VYEHDGLMVALKKTSKKIRIFSSCSHSPAEHDKCSHSGELRKLSLIVYLYGRHRCNILYIEFQHVSMEGSHLILLLALSKDIENILFSKFLFKLYSCKNL
jgi:hypothetical protein